VQTEHTPGAFSEQERGNPSAVIYFHRSRVKGKTETERKTHSRARHTEEKQSTDKNIASVRPTTGGKVKGSTNWNAKQRRGWAPRTEWNQAKLGVVRGHLKGEWHLFEMGRTQPLTPPDGGGRRRPEKKGRAPREVA